MSDLVTIVLTAALTLLGGFTLLVLGQVAQRWFIEPILAQRAAIGNVEHALLFHANVYMGGGRDDREKLRETSTALREAAARLSSASWGISCYKQLEMLRLVRRREQVREAVSALIGLSNIMFNNDIDGACEKRERVRNALELRERW